MPYTTPDRLERYLPLDIDGLAFDEPVYTQVIDDWSRYVNDYLSTVYKVPFPDYPNTPGMIAIATELLSVYDLYVRSGMAADKDDIRVNLWKRAHEILDKIAKKEVVLAGTDESGSGLIDTAAVMLTGPGNGPMSLRRQNQELGLPHSKTLGKNFFSSDDNEVV